jgi:hypothetical protein
MKHFTPDNTEGYSDEYLYELNKLFMYYIQDQLINTSDMKELKHYAEKFLQEQDTKRFVFDAGVYAN